MKREKTGGRQKGSRNKANLFNSETVEQAKLNIMELVQEGDIEASKLVISYSLAKPTQRTTGKQFELEELIASNEIEDRTRNERFYKKRKEAEENSDRIDEQYKFIL